MLMLSESGRCPAWSDQLVSPCVGQPRCSSSEQSVAGLRVPGRCPPSSDSALMTFPLERNALRSWAPLGPSAGKNGCFGSDCRSAPCRRAAEREPEEMGGPAANLLAGKASHGALGQQDAEGCLQGLHLMLAPQQSSRTEPVLCQVPQPPARLRRSSPKTTPLLFLPSSSSCYGNQRAQV